MKQTILTANPVAIVILLTVILFSQAHAATMSASATAPVIDGKDIANYATVTGNDKWFAENSAAGAVKGQTFTTGSGAVLLKSITYQVTASQKAEPTKQYVIRLGTVAGTTFTPVYTETATQGFTWSGGHFMTWTFDNPPLLNGNTVYGVDIGMTSSSSSWQTGIPYINVTGNDYPAGQRYSSGTSGVGTSSLTVVTSSDRIFHLDLEAPLGAALELVATDPADGATEVLASRPLTLTFSQNIAPGEGNILIRNLSDNSEIAIPAGAPALSYSENLLTVTPAGGLLWSRNYAVRIEPGAIENTTGSPFPGIADDSTWNFTTAAGDPLLDAIAQLKAHIRGTATLTAAQISAHKETIDNLRDQFDDTAVNIAAVFDLVTTYDTVKGPLWVARGEFNRTTQTNDLDWTIYHVMQYIMDVVYNAANLAKHESLLKGFKFGSSANFPGPCPPPPPGATHTATLNASFPATVGRITQGDDLPARKPTGCYLAPGTIATVTVPPSLVGQGFKVRVGAHSWDLSNRPPVRRLDRATLLYDINAATIKVASPYGGGIYIEVPRLANAGIVQVTIQGAARSPYFSAKSFHQTTAAEWEIERTHPAPWADFQSDKFMMQVPSKWINAHPDPAKLMADWDKAMDIQNDLMGFPRLRGKETQYPQVDVLMRSSVHAPGYPSVNNVDNPNNNRGGYHNNYLVRGPGANYHSTETEFHEQGHAYFFPKFGGETESNVNLPHVAILHRGFGYTLDEAFRGSRGSTRTFQTLDTAATAWMCVFNFAPRRVPMAEAEKAYQLKGHAKFVDIARLYGWDVLGDYWRSFMVDDANGVSYSTSTDALLLRLCRSVGKDIRPLFHFWGIHPQNNASLAASLAAENIPLDLAIRDRLLHYRSLVPANNAAFRTFATAWWGKQPNFSTGAWEEREHARQWDSTALYGAGDQQRTDETNPGEIYNEYSATDIRNRVDELLDLYFPDTNPFETWAGGFQALADSSPTLDPDRGGLATGIEWALGGDPVNPADDASLAPSFATAADPDGKFIFAYRRAAAARTDTNTSIRVEYGNSLSGWTTAVHQGNGPADITITETPGHFGPSIDRVTVALPAALAPHGRLFARLKVTVSPP
jgi:hypothetical protein